MIGLTVLLGFAVGSTGGASPGMEVVVRVAPSPVARVSPAFLSFTIDSAALRPIHCRWPCPDTADTSGVLAERVRHLSPMVLRVGGTSADNLEWAGDGAKPLPALPAVARAFGPQGNITTAKLDALMRFAEAVGGELVLGLNALLRVNASGTAQWDPRNARGLLRAVASARSPGSVTAFGEGVGRSLYLCQQLPSVFGPCFDIVVRGGMRDPPCAPSSYRLQPACLNLLHMKQMDLLFCAGLFRSCCCLTLADVPLHARARQPPPC